MPRPRPRTPLHAYIVALLDQRATSKAEGPRNASELALALGLRIPTFHHYLTGRRPLPEAVRLALARELGVPADRLPAAERRAG